MLEARVAKIERMLSEQRQSDLLLQLQQLQQEVQQLRGLVEKQQYLLQRRSLPATPSEQPAFSDAETAPPDALPAIPSSLSQDAANAAPAGLTGATGLTPRSGLIDALPATAVNAAPNPGLGAPRQPAGTLIDLEAEDALLPPLPAPETASGGERELYRIAFDHLKARDHDAARVAFLDVLEQYPRGNFAANSHYWLGEISYQEQDYPQARAAFEQLIQTYPSSPRVPGAMLKLGYLDADEQNLDQARVMLQTVIRLYPDSAEARLAAKRLTELNKATATPNQNP
jgi:tol-pal system protein YbgF